MPKKFRELIAEMSPARRARYDAGVARYRVEMEGDLIRLHELRRALRLSQQTLARKLKTDQAQISRLEQRADLLVSTLRRYVEALGGQLEIVATFPDGGRAAIENFSDLTGRTPPLKTPRKVARKSRKNGSRAV